VASGAGEAIEARIKALGTNVIVVMPGSFTSGGRRAGEGTAVSLSEGDLAAIRTKVQSIAVAGTVSGSAPVVVGNANWTTSVNGVNEDFLEVRDWPIADGRTFTDAELRSGAKVVILGATTAPELFSQGVLRSASMSASRMCPSP
jgi:putative ABC transport system permease protein